MKNFKQGMRKCGNCVLFVFLCVIAGSLFAQTTPEGDWKTYDDVTGKGKAIIHIFKRNGYLYGQIKQTFPTKGETPHKICTACTGSRHNQPILGMVIMEGLRPDANNVRSWEGGTILDPLSGKVYQCKLQVMNKGQQLRVRGFLGFSLFGRTQIWVRSKNS